MIKPLGQRVLLEKIEVEKKTLSGIVLPDNVNEEKNFARVVALGTGKKLENGTKESFDVKEGDKVIYSQYAATETKLDGKKYMIVDEKDILAILG
ncbi:MAG: groES [Haloplasmataceae bacterium]|jgi:chaperonin GroES|nr:groES [Haloplasmataceae bacterium]